MSPIGGFRLEVAINGLTVSLIDIVALVTLLCKDAWDRVSWAPQGPRQLSPCPALGLVDANGSPLLTFGSALVVLELNDVVLPVDVVVVSPLTSEGILGLDFLKKQRITIDLGSEQIQLLERDISIPLCTQATSPKRRIAVRAASNFEVPAWR